jgi:hypothetical protein
VGERPSWPVVRRECPRLFLQEILAARRRHRLRYHPLLPADISQTLGENLLAVLPALRPRTLATTTTTTTVGGPERRSRPNNER